MLQGMVSLGRVGSLREGLRDGRHLEPGWEGGDGASWKADGKLMGMGEVAVPFLTREHPHHLWEGEYFPVEIADLFDKVRRNGFWTHKSLHLTPADKLVTS